MATHSEMFLHLCKEGQQTLYIPLLKELSIRESKQVTVSLLAEKQNPKFTFVCCLYPYYSLLCLFISETEVWGRGEAAKHSDPQKVEDAFPLAITYQSDPKEASGSRIRMYITRHYGECNPERLKKALESGVEKGLWEQTKGSGASGTFHLLIDTFNPSRSKTLLFLCTPFFMSLLLGSKVGSVFENS